MAKRRTTNRHDGNHGFNLATVVQVFAIPVLTAMVWLIAQWVTQGDELKRHDVAISETIPKELKDEAQQREKNRAEFLDKLGKLGDGVNDLSKNVAIQSTLLGQIKDQLTPSPHR